MSGICYIDFFYSFPKNNFSHLEIKHENPYSYGFLKKDVKKLIEKIAVSWSRESYKTMCVVFGPRECMYCKPDGVSKSSREVPTSNKIKFPVPKGLRLCKKCGYFYGITSHKNNSIKISCSCEAIICKKCSKPVYKWKNGSSYYSPDNGKIWHVPVFTCYGHVCEA